MATISPELMAALRVRVGLPADDTSKDAQIQLAYDAAFEWLETYLDRFMEPGTYTETFTHQIAGVLSLKGYPTDDIVSFDSTEVPVNYVPAYHLEKSNGLVHMDGWVWSHELNVTYDCTPELTGAMQMAILLMFDQTWRTFGAKTSETVASGEVKATSIDGMRVEYNVGSSSSGSATGIDAETGLPEQVVGMLQPYRRMRT